MCIQYNIFILKKNRSLCFFLSKKSWIQEIVSNNHQYLHAEVYRSWTDTHNYIFFYCNKVYFINLFLLRCKRDSKIIFYFYFPLSYPTQFFFIDVTLFIQFERSVMDRSFKTRSKYLSLNFYILYTSL